MMETRTREDGAGDYNNRGQRFDRPERLTVEGGSDHSNRGQVRPAMSAGREQTQCRFCRRGIKYIDYKDIETLVKLLTNRGKIYSRKRSGNCSGCQRKMQNAIKRARYIALLPFTA
jgi:small subunit ribosomal protein S18